MRYLIFDPTLSGHHLEYIHHIYLGAIQRPEIEYVFAVPENEWQQVKDNQEWPPANNISQIMLDDHLCKEIGKGSLLAQSWKTSRFIKKIAVEHNIDKILLISIAPAIPFLPLILPKNIKLSGIIYKIYLRAPKKGLRGVIDKIRYSIMARSSNVRNVFILNDPSSTKKLNSLYKTNKFITLPDPVPTVNTANLRDMRKELGISPNDKVFLHFGAMEARKGTLTIIESILLMSDKELKDKTFIFAGKVGIGIRREFYENVEKCRKHGAKIIVEDHFLPYNRLNDICNTSDCILMPYLTTDLSSGVIGYAAVHSKPVIGPAKGLIGELITENNLGCAINPVNAESLKASIIEFKSIIVSSSYKMINDQQNFVNILMK